MNEYMKTLEEFNKLKNEYVAKLEKMVKGAIESAAKDVFEAFPRAVAISWTQYTPYFNDGDECIFGVGKVFLICDNDIAESVADGESPYDYEDEEGLVEASWSLREDPNVDALSFFEKLLADSSDIVQSVYGDHVQVTLTKTEEGIRTSIEEHEHE